MNFWCNHNLHSTYKQLEIILLLETARKRGTVLAISQGQVEISVCETQKLLVQQTDLSGGSRGSDGGSPPPTPGGNFSIYIIHTVHINSYRIYSLTLRSMDETMNGFSKDWRDDDIDVIR
jgi:hypothetical protein